MNDQETAQRILENAQTIAVLGMKGDDEGHVPAHQVPKYLARQGYRIIPVNPELADADYPNAVARLTDLEEVPDVVEVFRSPEAIDGHVEELLELKPSAVWFQLGIRNDNAAEQLRDAGIEVVQDRCMFEVHRMMSGGSTGSR